MPPHGSFPANPDELKQQRQSEDDDDAAERHEHGPEELDGQADEEDGILGRVLVDRLVHVQVEEDEREPDNEEKDGANEADDDVIRPTFIRRSSTRGAKKLDLKRFATLMIVALFSRFVLLAFLHSFYLLVFIHGFRYTDR